MDRRLAIAGGLVLLVAALYWGLGGRLSSPDAPPGDTTDLPRIPANVVGADEPWRLATSPAVNGLQARLRHPPAAEIDTTALRNRRLLRVTYAGPNNDPPALTDGFSVTVTLRDRPADTPLDTLVRRSIRTTRRVGGAVLAPVRPARVRGRPARRWTQESAMGGPVDHQFVALGERTVAQIAASVTGPDTARYERTIDTIRQTIRFVDRGRRGGPPAADRP